MTQDKDKAGPCESDHTALDKYVDATRKELLRLRQDLDQVRQEFNDTRAAQLLEANEQLVLTALRAETIAETAMLKLNDLTRVTQHDALTDTPNRALMLDRLQNAITLAKRRDARIAVVFVDIDHFKEINDSYGHAAGDAVLQLMARRLEQAVRESDTVSRHSGDEFLILLADITQVSDAALIAQKMLAAVAATPDKAYPFAVTASVGIAIYPDDGVDASSLIERADTAMYRAKKSGGATFEFYNNELTFDVRRAPLPHDPPAQRTASERSDEPGLHRLHDIRDVNEQLVLSSLAAHEAQEQATQAQRQQVKFLAMVAHELRNPLAPIRTAAELLNHARLDEKQHDKLQVIIKRQLRHMTRIIDDLLDGSRADAGKFHLKCATMDLIDVLNVAIDSCSPAMEAKLQHLSVQVLPGPINVHGDAVRLDQVFRNLLDNATKYTPKGGSIVLTVLLIHEAVTITVSDNGIGIPAAALLRVFDLFAQDPRAVAAQGGGLGIGLAVVRELVQAHGGSVVASSAGHDLGSEFVVTLPVMAD